MNGLGKLLIFTVVVMTVGSTAAVYFAPLSPKEGRQRRQAETQRLIDQLTQATWNYFHDHGEFPPGDGSGTSGLTGALRSASRTGAPYMVFLEDMLTPWGDLRNPAAPQTMVLCYRNNRDGATNVFPSHNFRTFDLWAWSPDGVEDGVNNWNSVVVPAP